MAQFKRVWLLWPVLGVGACASAPPPVERMASAEAAVRAAREVGSDRVPSAELQVKLAEEEIQKARALSNDGDNREAETMLLRASADAELAVALAREDQQKVAAQRALDQANELRSSPDRAQQEDVK